ncbi:MAG: hypothetical protein R2795_16715 [Saprospiraceae bacterium]
MRYLFTLSCLYMLFSGCVSYRPYPMTESKLTALDIPANENPVSLYMMGETLPEKDYLRIALLKESSVNANTNDLIGRLLGRAATLGADALLIQNISETEEVRELSESSYSVHKESVWGLAIKFKENLTYPGRKLSHIEVQGIGGNAQSEGGNIYLAANGEATLSKSTKLTKIAWQFSMEYLMESTHGCFFNKIPSGGSSDISHYLYRQHRNSSSLTTTQLKANLLQNGRVKMLLITMLNGNNTRIKLYFDYNEQNQLVSRWGEIAPGINYRINTTYHPDGSIAGETYESWTQGQTTPSPLLQTTYYYLSEEDWREQVEKEQFISSNN